MEFIGLGDLHFDKLNKLIPDVNDLIGKSLRKVLAYALDHGVHNIVFYGDIGEKSRLSYESQCCLYNIVLDKKYKDLHFRFILGNHDFDELGVHSLQVLETLAAKLSANVTVYSKPKIEVLEGARIKFLPHPYTDTEKDCVNIGHFETLGSIHDSGRKIKEGVDTKHICLLGHLHTNHRVKNCYYSGTLYQTNFGESLPKFFHHVSISRSNKIEVTDVPFTPPWKLENITILTEKDLDKIEANPRVLYKVFVQDGAKVDKDTILKRFPNVVKLNSFKSDKELKLMITGSWDLEESLVNYDDTGIIKTYLTDRGLSELKICRAMEILDSLKNN